MLNNAFEECKTNFHWLWYNWNEGLISNGKHCESGVITQARLLRISTRFIIFKTFPKIFDKLYRLFGDTPRFFKSLQIFGIFFATSKALLTLLRFHSYPFLLMKTLSIHIAPFSNEYAMKTMGVHTAPAKWCC